MKLRPSEERRREQAAREHEAIRQEALAVVREKKAAGEAAERARWVEGMLALARDSPTPWSIPTRGTPIADILAVRDLARGRSLTEIVRFAPTDWTVCRVRPAFAIPLPIESRDPQPGE